MSAPGEGSWIRPFEVDPASAVTAVEPPTRVAAASAGLEGLVARARGRPARPQAVARAGELAGESVLRPTLVPRAGGLWSRLFWVGLLAAMAAIALDTVDRLASRIATDPLTGWPMAILIAMVAASTVGLLGREAVGMARLRRRAHLRDTAARLTGSALHGSAPGLVAEVARGLPEDRDGARRLAQWRRQDPTTLSDGEQLRLFERTVLVPVDAQAYRLVLESSRDIGLLTAISPYGLLDGLLVLWRTTLMVRSVARLYGIAPGPAATVSLLRRCLRNAALAGLADVAAHAVLEHAGASLLSMLSSRAGQGAGNALLSAKLGLEAVRETRPLPFIEAAPPTLRQIRRQLLEADRPATRGPDDPDQG